MNHQLDTAVEMLNRNVILRLIFIFGAAAGVVMAIAGGFYATFRFIAWAGNYGF